MLQVAVEAEHLLEDLGFTDVPINLEEVCQAMSSESYEIVLEERSMISEGFHGISMGDANGAIILVNASIPNRHRKRFTAAHELGHVHLHIQTNKKSKFECTAKDISRGESSNDDYEKEANIFASSLLMPSLAISPVINKHDISWLLIARIKTLCDVSLEAAARRTIALCKDACCLIIHKDGEMWYPIKSRSFSSFIPTQPFPNYLNTELDDGDSLFPDGVEECDFSDWSFPDSVSGKLYYSSIHNSEFDRTMTLLLHEEDAEDDEDLSEPHF